MGVDGDAQRINQMVCLIFLKIFDDKGRVETHHPRCNHRCPAVSLDQLGDPEGTTGEELIDFVNNDLFPALKRLASSTRCSPWQGGRLRLRGCVQLHDPALCCAR